MKPGIDVIVTCEHGGNRVPRALTSTFKPGRGLLATHRAWDPGALELARRMSRRLKSPLFFSTTSRLVVDLNRSEHHPRFFSRVTAGLPEPVRQGLCDTLYRPFRAAVFDAVSSRAAPGKKVVHISVHSFTPVLAGIRRSADIGLLYDPARRAERKLAAAWRQALLDIHPGLRIRMNYPYRGNSDGHTTSLRGRFPADRYLGIELEINQAIVRAGGKKWARVQADVTAAIARVLAEKTHSPA